MVIKVIVEFKPNRASGLSLIACSKALRRNMGQAPGFLGSTRYEVVDSPNILVEVADWESAEMRAEAMQKVMVDGVYAPLAERFWPRHSGLLSSGNLLDRQSV